MYTRDLPRQTQWHAHTTDRHRLHTHTDTPHTQTEPHRGNCYIIISSPRFLFTKNCSEGRSLAKWIGAREDVDLDRSGPIQSVTILLVNDSETKVAA
jgi:hypothetical protein